MISVEFTKFPSRFSVRIALFPHIRTLTRWWPRLAAALGRLLFNRIIFTPRSRPVPPSCQSKLSRSVERLWSQRVSNPSQPPCKSSSPPMEHVTPGRPERESKLSNSGRLKVQPLCVDNMPRSTAVLVAALYLF